MRMDGWYLWFHSVLALKILDDAKGMAIFAERRLEQGMQAVCEAEV
jgi:hypothetical protein